MKKRIMCLIMAAAMGLFGAAPVFGEEHEGSKNWAVTFDGSKMSSNFSSAEMAEEIYSIQPGDSIRLRVALKNAGQQATGWYMTNQVLATLEESQSTAAGGAYTYRLVYEGPAGEEDVLYSSEAVGGEGDTSRAGEGLHQATGSLKDYFFLDTLNQGQEGSVYLTVSLDGESQGNDYQDTLAQLQMNFAVENADPVEVTVTPTPRTERNTIRRTLPQDSRNIVAASVQTSDPTQILPYCAAALAAGIALLILGAVVMKRRQRDQEQEGGSQE